MRRITASQQLASVWGAYRRESFREAQFKGCSPRYPLHVLPSRHRGNGGENAALPAVRRAALPLRIRDRWKTLAHGKNHRAPRSPCLPTSVPVSHFGVRLRKVVQNAAPARVPCNPWRQTPSSLCPTAAWCPMTRSICPNMLHVGRREQVVIKPHLNSLATAIVTAP